MPKFKILVTMETDLYAIVEAPNRDEAYRAAREDMDGADFSEEKDSSGDWRVTDAIEYDGDEEPIHTVEEQDDEV